jgi:glycosyltransferase involved in cell wall biosynthesis
MAERVKSIGVDAGRVHVIPNWTNDEELCQVASDENPLRREWELQHKFVVGYSGNLGRAHEFETVLSAAELLRNNRDILFLFAGGGHQFDRLAQAVKERGLDALFRFVPYQPQHLLKFSLSAADVHVVSLRPELEGLIVPSKFYGIAAVGRPVISITANDGEIARMVREHGCGLVVQPGDGRGLAENLKLLSMDLLRVAEMGKRARAMLDDRFSRKRALASWEQLLAALTNSSEKVLPFTGSYGRILSEADTPFPISAAQ